MITTQSLNIMLHLMGRFTFLLKVLLTIQKTYIMRLLEKLILILMVEKIGNIILKQMLGNPLLERYILLLQLQELLLDMKTKEASRLTMVRRGLMIPQVEHGNLLAERNILLLQAVISATIQKQIVTQTIREIPGHKKRTEIG